MRRSDEFRRPIRLVGWCPSVLNKIGISGGVPPPYLPHQPSRHRRTDHVDGLPATPERLPAHVDLPRRPTFRSWDALGAFRGVLGTPRAILARSWTLQGWISDLLDVDFLASASSSAKRLGIDFANTTQERRERLATTMQQRPDWGVHYALLESSIKY